MPEPGTPASAMDRGQALLSQQGFLLTLSDALRPLADPVAIQDEAVRVLGEHLGSDRVYYVEVDTLHAEYVVEREWLRSSVTSHAGRYPLEAWPMPWLADGAPWVVRDVNTDPAMPDEQRVAYRENDIGACVVVPLVKHGRLVATLVTNQTTPRDWTAGEVALLAETAERTWAAVERAHAEQALLRSESRLRALIEHLPGGAVFVVDHDLRYELVQGEALAAAGFTSGGLVGRTVAQSLAPELVAEYEARYRLALAGEEFEYEHASHGRAFITRGVPLRDAAGTISAALAVSYDITERKWAEAIIQDMNQLLEQQIDRRTRELADKSAALQASNEELEAFNYSVAHDLMTPVRHVEGFTSMAVRNLHDPDKARRSLDVVTQAARRMETLIGAMLTLSRTGRQELSVDVVDLGALTQQAQLDALSQVSGRTVEWHFGRLPLIHGERVTLQQVMTNLLDNAVKYTQGRDVAVIEVWTEEDERQWIVSVRDNGAGFNPAYAGKLFGIFQRLHRQNEFAGTGVGLSVVRRIILRHGGTVAATGEVGQGATFSFTLPKPGV